MTRTHRIWRQAAFAWVALVAIPTLIVAIAWQLGIDRDVDMHSAWELIFTFVLVLTLPMGALAYLVLAPLAIAIDRSTRGCPSRWARLAIGASLAVPAFVVANLFGWAMDWNTIVRVGIRSSIEHAIRQPEPLLILLADFIVAGVIVSLGLRRATTPLPR